MYPYKFCYLNGGIFRLNFARQGFVDVKGYGPHTIEVAIFASSDPERVIENPNFVSNAEVSNAEHLQVKEEMQNEIIKAAKLFDVQVGLILSKYGFTYKKV